MSIADKLITIANNTSLVAEVINSTIVTDSGTAVRVEPFQDSNVQVKTRLRSKNLFNYIDWVNYCNSGTGSRAIGDDIYLEQECFSYGNWRDSTAPMFENITFKENTRYTFSLDVAFSYKENESYSMPVFAVYYTDGTNTLISRTLYSNAFTAITFTSAENKTIANISTPRFGNNATIYVKKTMQIEEGTTATVFTPYRSGTGGKNLLPLITKWTNGKDVQYFPTPIHMKAGQKYAFSFQGEYTAWRLMFFGTQMDGTIFPYDTDKGGSQDVSHFIYNTYSTPNPDGTIRIQYQINMTGNNCIVECREDFLLTAMQFWNTGEEITPYTKVQLEEGDTSTEYEPYINDFDGMEVQAFGKNLFDINSPQYSGAVVTGAVVNDELVVTSKSSAKYISANYVIPNGDMLVGKTLTVSGEWEESGTNVGALRLGWTKIGNIHHMDTSIGATKVSGTPFSKTIGAKPSTADKLCLWIYCNFEGSTGATGDTVTYRNIQVELDNSATEYEPYKVPLTVTAAAKGNIAESLSISHVITVIPTDPSATVECTYFPTSAEDVYNKAQEIKTAIVNLKKKLT